jgi:hypothetical protein
MRFHSSQGDGTYMHATYLISIYKEPKSICHNMLNDLRLLAMTKLSLTYQILTLLIGGSFFVEMSVGSDTNHGQYQDFDA